MRALSCVLEALKSRIGWLFLSIAPILLLGMVAIAFTGAFSNSASNSADQSSRLLCQVNPKVTWVNEPIAYTAIYQPIKTEKNHLLPETDIMYVVDVSSSMGNDAISAVKEAIKNSFQKINLLDSTKIRLSLVQFQSETNILMDWTSDISKALDNVDTLVSSGNTDIDSVFSPINKLFDHSSPKNKKVLIFYTDGEFDSITIKKEIEKLTEKNVEIYVVTPYFKNGTLITLAGNNSSRVYSLNGSNSVLNSDLSRTIANVIYRSLPSSGSNVSLAYIPDTQNFSYGSLNNSVWYLSKDSRVVAKSEGLLDYKHSYTHELIPKEAGFWHIGLSPISLEYIDESNTKTYLECESEPVILVLDWWLFLVFLPLVIWFINICLKDKTPAKSTNKKENKIPSLPVASYPNSKLPFPSKEREYHNTIPTLFIFIGDKPQEVFQSVHEALSADYNADVDKYFSSLLIGVDKAHTTLNIESHKLLFIPEEIKHIASYSREYLEGRSTLPWLDAEFFRDQSIDEQNYSGRSKSSRKTARLILSRWLQENNDLKDNLRKAIKCLMDTKTEENTSLHSNKKTQIILIVDQNDVVGNTWLLDISVLSRRLIQNLVKDDVLAVPPDILAMLWTKNSTSDINNINDINKNDFHKNRHAFFKELETLQKLGAYPHRNYLSEKLNEVDSQAPFNKIIHINLGECENYFGLKQILPNISQPLLNKHLLNSTKQDVFIKKVHGLWEPLDQWHKAIKLHTLLIILGEEVLFDLNDTETYTEDKAYFPEINEKDIDNTFKKIVTRYEKSLKNNDDNYLLLFLQLMIQQNRKYLEATQKVLEYYRSFVENKSMPDVKWWQESIIEVLNYNLYGGESDNQKQWSRYLTFNEYRSVIVMLETKTKEIIGECNDQLSNDREIKNIFEGLYELLSILHNDEECYKNLILEVVDTYRKEKEECIERISQNKNSVIKPDQENDEKIKNLVNKLINDYARDMLSDWLLDDAMNELRKHIYLKLENDYQNNYKESLQIIIQAADSDDKGALAFSISNFDDSLVVLERYIENIVNKYVKLDVNKIFLDSKIIKNGKNHSGHLGSFFTHVNKREEYFFVSPISYEQATASNVLSKDTNPSNYLHNKIGLSSINTYYLSQANPIEQQSRQEVSFNNIPFVKETEFNTQWMIGEINSLYGISSAISEKFNAELRILLSNREKLIKFATLYDNGFIDSKYDKYDKKQWFLNELQITRGESNTLLDAGIYIMSYVALEQDINMTGMKEVSSQSRQELYSELLNWEENNYEFYQHENISTILVQLIIASCLKKQINKICSV